MTVAQPDNTRQWVLMYGTEAEADRDHSSLLELVLKVEGNK